MLDGYLCCRTISSRMGTWLKHVRLFGLNIIFLYKCLRLRKEPSCCMDVGTLASSKGCSSQ